MDTQTVLGGLVLLFGGGSLGGILVRWLTYRKGREASIDERYHTLIDELQGTAKSLRRQVDALLHQQAAMLQQQATMQAELKAARDESAGLRRLLALHGITDLTPPPEAPHAAEAPAA